MKYGWKIALAIVGVGLLLGAATVVAWGLTPLGPDDEALAALLSDGNVTVRDDGSVIVFVPAPTDPVTGFILYPGGHVDHRSYAPVAREIARQGYLVAVVAMPLSLLPYVSSWVFWQQPANAQAHYSLALVYLRTDRPHEAAQEYLKVSELDGKLATALRKIITAGQDSGSIREDLTVTDLYLLVATGPLDHAKHTRERWLELIRPCLMP